MIDRDMLRSAYRAVLGREPESPEVEADKLKWTPDLQHLIGDLIASREFQGRVPRGLYDAYDHPAARIDVDVTPGELEALFARLRGQWEAMGQSDPYWSVLTHEQYRNANLTPEALDDLYATGAEDLERLDAFCSRNQWEPRAGICVELGCGVGRVTRHLATRFDRVIGVDISEGNLSQARAMAERLGLTNIEFVHLRTPTDLARLPDFDLLYSTMVFQHNPPPVQKYQLDLLLGKIRRKGAFLFQLQTYEEGYSFSIKEFLASGVGAMDMHALPMHEVLGLIRKHRLPVFEVTADFYTGRFGSYTFFGGGRPKRRFLARLFG